MIWKIGKRQNWREWQIQHKNAGKRAYRRV